MTRHSRLLSILSLGIAIAGGAASAAVAEAADCVGPATVKTSRIAGQAFDATYGGPFPGAKVTISGPGDRYAESETGEDGYFAAPQTWPGRNRLRVEATGFTTLYLDIDVDSRAPFRQVAVSLGFAMECGSTACSVMLQSPISWTRPPSCLSEASWAAERADIDKRIDRQVGRCGAGNEGACRHLVRVAEGDKNEYARTYAAGRLTDQSVLIALARHASSDRVRTTAAGKLTDAALLATFAESDPSADVRRAALASRYLTDQTVFERVATSTSITSVREAAVARLTNQDLLRRLALEDKDPVIQTEAIDALTDQRILLEFLQREQEEIFRDHIVRNKALTDQDVLADVAMRDRTPRVRLSAALKLSDQALAQRAFAEIVQIDSWDRWHWAPMAVSRLTDRDLLIRLAVSDPISQVREAADATLKRLPPRP